MKKFLVPVLMALILAFGLQAADDEFNNPVTIDESFSQVVVTYTFTFVDSSDKYHSVPIFIGDCNDVNAYVSAIQSASGDANVIYHFSSVDDVNEETAIWHSTTPAGLDAFSSTAVFDTLGHEAGSDDIKFHSARWLIVEILGGGTGNADDNVVTFIVSLTKDKYFIENGQPVRVSRAATHAYTNP